MALHPALDLPLFPHNPKTGESNISRRAEHQVSSPIIATIPEKWVPVEDGFMPSARICLSELLRDGLVLTDWFE